MNIEKLSALTRKQVAEYMKTLPMQERIDLVMAMAERLRYQTAICFPEAALDIAEGELASHKPSKDAAESLIRKVQSGV